MMIKVNSMFAGVALAWVASTGFSPAMAESSTGADCNVQSVFTNATKPPLVYTQNGVASSQSANPIKVACSVGQFLGSGSQVVFQVTGQAVGGNMVCTLRNVKADQSAQVFKSVTITPSSGYQTVSGTLVLAYSPNEGGLMFDCTLPGPASKLSHYDVSYDFYGLSAT